MVRRRVELELEAELVDATRAVAARSGVAEDELVERALREVLAGDFAALMEEIAADQAARGVRLSDDEAMAIAVEEVRASRAERAGPT
jgi:hypothetical protein